MLTTTKKKQHKSKKMEDRKSASLTTVPNNPVLPPPVLPSVPPAKIIGTVYHEKKPYKLEVMPAPVVLTQQVFIKTDFDGSEFISDRYAKRRGESKMLQLFCISCSGYIMSYQKDGPGQLLRCYLDRIHHPKKLQELQDKKFDLKTADNLPCNTCKAVVGVPMIYQSEKRPAFRMLPNKTHYNTLKL
jgi:hypothetical protein